MEPSEPDTGWRLHKGLRAAAWPHGGTQALLYFAVQSNAEKPAEQLSKLESLYPLVLNLAYGITFILAAWLLVIITVMPTDKRTNTLSLLALGWLVLCSVAPFIIEPIE